MPCGEEDDGLVGGTGDGRFHSCKLLQRKGAVKAAGELVTRSVRSSCPGSAVVGREATPRRSRAAFRMQASSVSMPEFNLGGVERE